MFTDANGLAKFYTAAGTFPISLEISNDYFQVNPSGSQDVTFADAESNTANVAFCVSPIGIHYDPEITIIPLEPARPGFDASYRISYKNIGNHTLSGSVNFTYDDAVLDFVSSEFAPDAQSGGSLSWNYTSLLPFETRSVDVTLNLNSPMEEPAVNNDDILNFNAAISIASGEAETPENNTFHFPQTVVGSYDPNDKTCLEGAQMTPQMVGDYLHYLIRFQNTGTFYAQNVVVEDEIDATKFDISTLEVLSMSHTGITRVEGNKVKFIFENIMLPAEEDDEPNSHGFVAFKIKTLPTLVLEDEVTNIANIYFDFNWPIITEPAITTVSELGTKDFTDASVAVFPNPVKNKVSVTADNRILKVELFDVQGRKLQTVQPQSERVSVDMTQYASGVYFLRAETEKGHRTEKLVRH